MKVMGTICYLSGLQSVFITSVEKLEKNLLGSVNLEEVFSFSDVLLMAHNTERITILPCMSLAGHPCIECKLYNNHFVGLLLE